MDICLLSVLHIGQRKRTRGEKRTVRLLVRCLGGLQVYSRFPVGIPKRDSLVASFPLVCATIPVSQRFSGERKGNRTGEQTNEIGGFLYFIFTDIIQFSRLLLSKLSKGCIEDYSLLTGSF